jgi:hypothetical protein
MDENLLAKLIDIGTELRFAAGAVVSSPDEPRGGMLLVMQGLLRVGDDDDRGPGHVVGQWERLDEVQVVAETDVRLVAIDRADWEAAQTG